MNCVKRGFLTRCVATLLVAWTTSGQAQDNPPQIGVFFDTAGNSCNTTLIPFGSVRAHLLAFVEPGVELGGAFFRLQVPPSIDIEDVQWAKNSNHKGGLTATTGAELIFQVCPTTTGAPVTLVSFLLTDVSFGGPRPDLLIDIGGGTITAPDTLTLRQPNFKVCDPNDPEGYSDLIVATSTRTTMNCSAGECPCSETALTPTTWTALRKLYADD